MDCVAWDAFLITRLKYGTPLILSFTIIEGMGYPSGQKQIVTSEERKAIQSNNRLRSIPAEGGSNILTRLLWRN
ncbi:hypothetical protein RND71_039451 [Anisodus tanguticus]|uniref:Uncharacterized protein n=1 Tax=Anisodus tanguticus TaxID=243964 RepID=A0AAE1QWM7_9SOLA|nr:hypothetical protein RND71_039451 [Anisodus tanguticus]